MKCPQPIYIGCGDQNQLSKAQRTNRCPGDYELLHYSADITAGSLKVQESRIVADLLLRGVDATGWKAAIVRENVLQARNPGHGVASIDS